MEEKPNGQEIDLYKMPSSSVIDDFVNNLGQVDLTKITYEKVYQIIEQTLLHLPILTSDLKKGTIIDRARPSQGGALYYTEKDISYRTDYWNIKDFGRANIRGQSMFYAAIPTEEIREARMTLLHEISPQFRNPHFVNHQKEYMVVGKWELTHDLTLVDMVFHDAAIRNNKRIKEAFEFHMKNMQSKLGDRFDDVIKVQKFFSDQFAQEKDEPKDVYKISAAYSNFVVIHGRGRIAGVAYPSVRMGYQGSNIAVLPEAVEQAMILRKAALIETTPTGEKNMLMSPTKAALDLGILNTEFKWLDATYDEETMTGTLTPMEKER